MTTRRNYTLTTIRRDALIEWMKEILHHSFVLNSPQTYPDSFQFFEDCVEEYRFNPTKSKLKTFVPSIGKIHTRLCLKDAWLKYDQKYCVSSRRHITPSFNELRHILNLSQVMAIGRELSLISFDGDQTLYSDGGNFAPNADLAKAIIELMKAGVTVAVITAAGYGNDGEKYAVRLRGLLDSFIHYNLTPDELSRFYIFGGECNYLLQACYISSPRADVILAPVDEAIWQSSSLGCPVPNDWPQAEINRVLDLTENALKNSIQDLRLRARLLRKSRAVGIFPGGDEMAKIFPKGHGKSCEWISAGPLACDHYLEGSKKLKREALDETVLRVMDVLRSAMPPISIPYCVFNGGRDAWLDIGNKSVGIRILQCVLGLQPSQCLHVGDQFLSHGNDYSARETSPCAWIISPKETEKILEHVLQYKLGGRALDDSNGDYDLSFEDTQDHDESQEHTSSKYPSVQSNDTVPCSPMNISTLKPSKSFFDVYSGESS